MKTLFVLVALSLPCAACPESEHKEQKTDTVVKSAPIPIKTIISKPVIEVLKTESSETNYYEKWRKKKLVVFGLLPATDTFQYFEVEGLKYSGFDLKLQSAVKKADFKKRLSELKQDLEAIDTSDFKSKKWATSSSPSRTEYSFPKHEIFTVACQGQVHYTWLYREYEIEGVKQGKKTMFKATVRLSTGGSIMEMIPKGMTFDMNTGEQVAGEITLPKDISDSP